MVQPLSVITWNRARHGAAMMAIVLFAACSAGDRLPAVPSTMEDQAQVPGMPGVKYSGDMTALAEDFRAGIQRERDALAAAGHTGPLPPANFLALSGGGDKGAFGAGILVGWSKAGTRPEFKLVTGVSTGALIAPFAFLGSKYDPQLQAVFTNVSGKDIP